MRGEALRIFDVGKIISMQCGACLQLSLEVDM